MNQCYTVLDIIRDYHIFENIMYNQIEKKT